MNMARSGCTFIATVLNEEKTIDSFITSVLNQSKKPDEIIIVDGGSKDSTVKNLQKYSSKISVYVKKGNRSVGRNVAITKAKNPLILISDAGCTLDWNWVKNITQPFTASEVEVVAGYYKGEGKSVFQKCLIPYILVMPDRVDASNFLPATRSMALKKSVWKKLGGFNERLSDNEDYAFAQVLRKNNTRMAFAQNAIAYWIPPSGISSAFRMFFRFARGDMRSRSLRPKVFLIFLRYSVAFVLIAYFFYFKYLFYIFALGVLVLLYGVWSVEKNYTYVKKTGAIAWLPIIQILSDIAVMGGTIMGLYTIPEQSRYGKA